jgi:hypothetical protein
MKAKKSIEDKISLKMLTDGFGSLQRNGYDLLCPFIQPMQIRQRVNSSVLGGGAQEQIAIQKAICNTGCPLLKINDDETVTVCCGGTPVSHKIEKVIEVTDSEPKPKGDGKIISFNNPKGEA